MYFHLHRYGFLVVIMMAGICYAQNDTPAQSQSQREVVPQLHDRIESAIPSDSSEDSSRDRRYNRNDQFRENPDNNQPLSPPQPEEPNEFQRLVLDATGQSLPIFGRGLFRNVPSTFAPINKAPVPQDYVIGPGDEIVIKGWGQIDIDFHGIVDRAGALFIPRVGNVNLAGMRFGDLRRYLKSVISRTFQNFDLDVSLGQLRSIQVYVVGQAVRPGTYTVSSLSTLVNALFSAGGPSRVGSMRHIQLKRGSQLVADFDLYDLLLRGDKSKDVSLAPGDVIYIPTVGPTVAILGSVNIPAIYEINQGSTALKELLTYAGGITSSASAKNVTIERINDHSVRSVEELQIGPQSEQTNLRDGDIITVRPLSARFEKAVTIRGNVAYPGRYPWVPGMHITDLIPSREVLLTRKFWMEQSGLAMDDLGMPKLQPDQATPSATPPNAAIPANAAPANVAPTPNPVTTSVTSSIPQGTKTLREQVGHLQSEINWEYAVIERLDRQSLRTTLVPFNLGQALDGDLAQNKALEDGDVITIFSQSEIRVGELASSKFITLQGEFVAPGIYEARPGETLRSLVTRVGGLTPQAYLFGSELLRESSRKEQQAELDRFIQRLELDVETTASNKSQNIVSPEEAVGLRERVESQRQLVVKLRQLRATGRIVIGVKPFAADLASIPEVVLEDGDRFSVPRIPSTVNVLGAVFSNNSYIYRPNRTLNHYLKLAGGGTQGADAGHAFVVRADGSVVRRSHNSGWFAGDSTRLFPGDSVIVPEQLSKVSILKGLKDWSQVFGQFALGAAAIKVIAP